VKVKKSWISAHPRVVIGFILVVCLGPFINKPSIPMTCSSFGRGMDPEASDGLFWFQGELVGIGDTHVGGKL